MAHVHQIGNRPHRIGATSCPPENGGSGAFRAFGPEVAAPHSPAVEGAARGGGLLTGRPVAASDFASAHNAPAAVVLAAPGPGCSHAVHAVDCGYTDTPTAGQLTITDGTTTYRVPVTSAGPAPIDFRPPLVFAPNAAVSGSLSAGGASTSGYFGFTGRSVV